MRTKSKAEQRLMLAAAHSPKFSKKVKVPQSVAKEFVAADKKAGRLKSGGSVANHRKK